MRIKEHQESAFKAVILQLHSNTNLARVVHVMIVEEKTLNV